MGAELFHADGQTDMTKQTVTFRSFANSYSKNDTRLMINSAGRTLNSWTLNGAVHLVVTGLSTAIITSYSLTPEDGADRWSRNVGLTPRNNPEDEIIRSNVVCISSCHGFFVIFQYISTTFAITISLIIIYFKCRMNVFFPFTILHSFMPGQLCGSTVNLSNHVSPLIKLVKLSTGFIFS